MHNNSTSLKKTPSGKHPPRRDGIETRNTLLDAAGRAFAERGYADTTSKDICTLAGTNSAAVNYYFGSKENLYAEVLAEAHHQLVRLDDVNRIMDAPVPAEEKLRAMLRHFIQTACASPDLWGIRVLLREIVSPSENAATVIPAVILPKAMRFKELVHQLTGLPVDTPQTQQATAFVVLPCISLIMFPEKLRTLILPATASSEESLLDALQTYILGGLRAMTQTGKTLPASRNTRP